jgi:hypothetical protein
MQMRGETPFRPAVFLRAIDKSPLHLSTDA